MERCPNSFQGDPLVEFQVSIETARNSTMSGKALLATVNDTNENEGCHHLITMGQSLEGLLRVKSIHLRQRKGICTEEE